MSFLALLILAVSPAQSAATVRRQALHFDGIDSVELRPGQRGELRLRLRVEEGFHVQANPASAENLIALQVRLEPEDPQALRLGGPLYPKASLHALKPRDASRPAKILATYAGAFSVRIPVTAAKRAREGVVPIRGVVRYQACDDRACLLPANLPVSLSVRISSAGPDHEARVRGGKMISRIQPSRTQRENH